VEKDGPQAANRMETDMAAKIPVLPLAGSTALRASLAAIALVTYWIKALARARRHRRQAHVLAGLDRRMLADIGITRADVRDAFSEPFWEDPTALLRERALERRLNRHVTLTRTAPGRPTTASAVPASTGPHARRFDASRIGRSLSSVA
jgi:uncharacterized protein YjiS (DUF1127 family)